MMGIDLRKINGPRFLVIQIGDALFDEETAPQIRIPITSDPNRWMLLGRASVDATVRPVIDFTNVLRKTVVNTNSNKESSQEVGEVLDRRLRLIFATQAWIACQNGRFIWRVASHRAAPQVFIRESGQPYARPTLRDERFELVDRLTIYIGKPHTGGGKPFVALRFVAS